jgi:hypothetical protein
MPKFSLYDEHKADAFLSYVRDRNLGRVVLNSFGYKTLASAGFSRRDVRLAIDNLLTEGLIRVTHDSHGILVVTARE